MEIWAAVDAGNLCEPSTRLQRQRRNPPCEGWNDENDIVCVAEKKLLDEKIHGLNYPWGPKNHEINRVLGQTIIIIQ